MGIVIVVVCLGSALNLALWSVVYAKLGGLPLGVWQVAQRSRAADETRALDVLQSAAASRVGALVIALRSYQEQLGGIVQAQIAEAEVRARVSERRSSEAGAALLVASSLIRDLRTLAEDLPSLFDRRAMATGIAIGEATARKPPLAPRPGLASGVALMEDEGDRPSEDELTQVATRPLPGVIEACEPTIKERP